jgi:hypothetical protein
MTVYDHLARQLDRNTDLEALTQRLWIKLEDANILLASALHELHAATRSEHKLTYAAFTSRWYRARGVRL